MPEITQHNGKISLILAGGPDNALFRRVRGWRIWEEAHIYYQAGPGAEGAPAVERVELVANAEQALVIQEAVFGRRVRNQGYHHARAGPPPQDEGSGASLGSRRAGAPPPPIRSVVRAGLWSS